MTMTMEDTTMSRADDTEWMADAKCRGVDPGTFYDHSEVEITGTTRAREMANATKALFCSMCSVQEACLDYALATRQREGIWGGMTEKERIALRRRNARSAR